MVGRFLQSLACRDRKRRSGPKDLTWRRYVFRIWWASLLPPDFTQPRTAVWSSLERQARNSYIPSRSLVKYQKQ